MGPISLACDLHECFFLYASPLRKTGTRLWGSLGSCHSKVSGHLSQSSLYPSPVRATKGLFPSLHCDNQGRSLKVKSKKCDARSELSPQEISLLNKSSLCLDNLSKSHLRVPIRLQLQGLLLQVSRSQLGSSRFARHSRFGDGDFHYELSSPKGLRKKITDFQFIQLFLAVGLGVTTSKLFPALYIWNWNSQSSLYHYKYTCFWPHLMLFMS